MFNTHLISPSSRPDPGERGQSGHWSQFVSVGAVIDPISPSKKHGIGRIRALMPVLTAVRTVHKLVVHAQIHD